MRLVEIITRPTDAERSELVAFVDHVGQASARSPLSDHLWLDLRSGNGDGFIAVRLAEPGRTLALAQISTANDAAVLEVVVRPEVTDATALVADAVATAVDSFRRAGGGRLTWWLDDPGTEMATIASQHGLQLARELHEMRRPLPHPDHATIETRGFVVGSDEDAWLSVNNRAFAEHPEQGGWTASTLSPRLREPWFDPDGFRLYDRDGTLAGFCWTKVHDPGLGEIYVIAVDPAFHGQGLGRELTLAGLDWLTSHGITTVMLYVDGANAAAHHLYTRLGFTISRTRAAFAGTLVSDEHERVD